MASEEVLECSLCCERYDDNKHCPRLLTCGHTLCSVCLEQLLTHGSIQCPQDRQKVAVPAGEQPEAHLCEICGGEQHPAVSRCLECQESMCQIAADFHLRHKLSRDHRLVTLAELKSHPQLAAISVLCLEHKDPFRYFDQDCGQLICRDCFALKHHGHKCQSIVEAAAHCREGLRTIVEQTNATAGKLQAAEERVETVSRELDYKHEQEAAKIHTVFEEAHATLVAREQALVAELKQQNQTKASVLTQQRDSLRTVRARLTSASHHTATAIKSSDPQLLAARSDIMSTLSAIESQRPVLEPQADAALEFAIDRDRLLGMLAVAGKGAPRGTGGDTFVVELKDRKGQMKVDVKLEDKGDAHQGSPYTITTGPPEPVRRSHSGKIVQHIILQNGVYRITSCGAKAADGEEKKGGTGAIISAEFDLKKGDWLHIL
eukprot:g48464.t1